ncbi:hypothetical protein [Brevibacillus thermoruber]|jgi:hypothetical protein|uniref:hypothetical protein n=1 Tax=Brevibacillus thermoruber TaxID=33942 RepID=UPI0005541BAE|nr:hypothetical protein [Brevibacillus thermoruber]
MKAWCKTVSAVLCGGAILLTAGPNVEPVHAKTVNPQAFATVVRIQPQQSITFQITFVDGFRAQVTSSHFKGVTTVDVSPNKDGYVKYGVYQANGKLRKPITGFAEKLVQLVPYYEADGSIRYLGRQTLWGVDGYDRIAVATSVWTLVNQKPQLVGLTIDKGDWDNMPSPDVDVNTGFSMDKDSTFVLDTRYADVTGDGVRDHVLLVGHKMGASMNLLADDLRLVVREGKTNQQTYASVGQWDQAYLPKLHIGRYNQDSVNDILITMPTETGKVYSLMTWKGNRPAALIDQKTVNNPAVYQPVIGRHGEAVGLHKVTPKPKQK